MEKIYMEENQQQQQQKQQQRQQKRLLNISIVLSFAVAIFGIFTVASFGLATFGGKNSGVSYAAPIDADSFVLKSPYKVWDSNYNAYSVPLYFANSGTDVPVFCIEHAISPGIDDTYNKQGEEIKDYGLLYLLDHSFAKGISITDARGDDAKYVEAWVTQTAIWDYLNQRYPSDPNHAITDAQKNAMQSAQELFLVDNASGTDRSIYTSSTPIYAKYVQPLVTKAIQASSDRFLKVDIDTTNPASIAEDKSFYESPTITVGGEGLLEYDVSIGGVDGAYLVDMNGNNMNATNIPASTTQFKVRIPASKVGTEKLDVTVSATGHFDYLTGNEYVAAANQQKVVTVTGTTKDVSDGATFQIIPTPPTGMNVAQTIYFIGLIVLLCGVGIVYANAKPIENKQ